MDGLVSVTGVVVPALNEETALSGVLTNLRTLGVLRVVVVDGGSSDRTRDVAEKAGATVILEPRRGYGRACLRGIERLAHDGEPEVLAILDADGSSDPADLVRLLAKLQDGFDLVLGSRTLGEPEPGAIAAPALWGNLLSSALIRWWTGVAFTDSGPLRVLRWTALHRLGMRDTTWGWNVEMQMKAARAGLRIAEIPVRYARRVAGKSKISGNIVGVIRASGKILYALGRDAFWKPISEGAP